MSYLSTLPSDLKEALLYYFYLSDVIYFVDNLTEFSYLGSKDKEYFWADIYHTFWSSQDVNYQNMLRRLDRQHVVIINERKHEMMRSHILANELDRVDKHLNNEYDLNMAVSYGNLHFVKLLHSKGCKITLDMIEEAGAYGHFDVFKYCFEHIENPDSTLFHQPSLDSLLSTIIQCIVQYDNGICVKNNRLKTARYLVSKGASVESLPIQCRNFFNSL